MSSRFTAASVTPALVQRDRVAGNNVIAPATGLRRIAHAYNSVSSNHRKLLYARGTYTPPTVADADETNHYFVFRTGENVHSVTAWLGLRPAQTVVASARAYCTMELYDGTDTLISSSAYFPEVSNRYEMSWQRVTLDVDSTALAPNTEYVGRIRQYNYCLLQSVMVYEVAADVTDSSETGVCDPSYWETNKPIYDAGAQDLAQTGYKLWAHNGTQLISWGRESEANAPTLTGTTQVNLLDTSLTGGTWSATSPGFVLNTQYHDTQQGDVPVVLGVYATRTAGGGDLSVYVKRNGSTIITASASYASSPFDSSTHTIIARASDKVDIILAAASGATWRIDAIGLWEYEA